MYDVIKTALLSAAKMPYLLFNITCLQALNNIHVKSTVIQDAFDALNTLGTVTQRITLNWIKAHNDHRGNEYADIMANMAANCTQEQLLVPIAYNL